MYVTSQKIVLDDIMHQMLINQTLILLACMRFPEERIYDLVELLHLAHPAIVCFLLSA